MRKRTLRGQVAVAGVGETTYYKHGQSPDAEFKLALQAILAACADAGISAKQIDGFASYSNDRNEPSRLAAALGIPDLKFSNMHWGGGGGGGSGAVGNAAAAIATGMADCVVVYRALAQGQFARFGQGDVGAEVSGEDAFTAPYGLMSPAQKYGMRNMRFMHEYGVARSALRSVSMASYHHAQSNPRAIMYGRPLTEDKYDNSRWICEPYRLFDCCLENDGAAALILVAAERAPDLAQVPVYLLGAAQGSEYRNGAPCHNAPLYGTSSFTTVAPRLYEMAELSAADVDVVQSYENFSGAVVMSCVEHGFCEAEAVNEFFQLENLIAPSGKMPLNTSGGNLAECYMHGLELQVEAVRQVRGQSTAQVPSVDVSLVMSGPMVTPTSSCVFGSAATL
jgi:acetyl-CoA acetyltransferase